MPKESDSAPDEGDLGEIRQLAFACQKAFLEVPENSIYPDPETAEAVALIAFDFESIEEWKAAAKKLRFFIENRKLKGADCPTPWHDDALKKIALLRERLSSRAEKHGDDAAADAAEFLAEVQRAAVCALPEGRPAAAIREAIAIARRPRPNSERSQT